MNFYKINNCNHIIEVCNSFYIIKLETSGWNYYLDDNNQPTSFLNYDAAITYLSVTTLINHFKADIPSVINGIISEEQFKATVICSCEDELIDLPESLREATCKHIINLYEQALTKKIINFGSLNIL
jgi:hypothetical protein